MKILFNGMEHKNKYERCLSVCGRNDCETRPVMYLLALVCENDSQVLDCFDFKETHIKTNCFTKSWQTGGSVRAIKLAFNLWNGYNKDSDVYSVFGQGSTKYLIEAIKLRYES